MMFRERDGACVSYSVTGRAFDLKYPYRENIPTLREAVEIARSYAAAWGPDATTRVQRSLARRAPPSADYHHVVYQTHEWRVYGNGGMQLLFVRHHWQQRPDARGLHGYIWSLPRLPRQGRALTLRAELVDLADIADKLGLFGAARHLRAEQSLAEWRRSQSMIPEGPSGERTRIGVLQRMLRLVRRAWTGAAPKLGVNFKQLGKRRDLGRARPGGERSRASA